MNGKDDASSGRCGDRQKLGHDPLEKKDLFSTRRTRFSRGKMCRNRTSCRRSANENDRRDTIWANRAIIGEDRSRWERKTNDSEERSALTFAFLWRERARNLLLLLAIGKRGMQFAISVSPTDDDNEENKTISMYPSRSSHGCFLLILLATRSRKCLPMLSCRKYALLAGLAACIAL